MVKYVDAFTDISVTDIKVNLMRTAYDNEDALLSSFDPRVVLVWTVLFMIILWLFYDALLLTTLPVAAFVLATLSWVSKYLLALLLFGQVTNVGFFVVLVPFIDGVMRAVGRLGDNAGRVVEGVTTGDVSVLAETGAIVTTVIGWGIHTVITSREVGIDATGAFVPFFLKLTIISVISLAIFSAISPQRLSKGMLRLGVPRQLTSTIAYGYWVMSLLVEEYHAFINPFRLRSKVPEKQGLFRWRYFSYLLTLSAKAFYPLTSNAAKRSRINVEAMETEGLLRSLGDEQSQALRTEGMTVRIRDVMFIPKSLPFVAVVWMLT